MKLKENNSAQKLRGAYYTPLPLAEMMVKLFSSDESIKTVFILKQFQCDPCFDIEEIETTIYDGKTHFSI